MPKQREAKGSQKYNQLPLWKRMTLLTAILSSGGSLATLVPSQATYAHSSKSNTVHPTEHSRHKTPKESVKLLVVCKAGHGGKGGSATRKSSGAAGGAGGNCVVNVPINVFLMGQNNKNQTTSTPSPEASHSARLMKAKDQTIEHAE